MYKGIFWLITDRSGEERLLTVKVLCDELGQPLEAVSFSSKSRQNFNHQAEWAKLPAKLTRGKPYNYFPRGRVEVKSGKVTVYCHPDLAQEQYRNEIIRGFSVPQNSRFVADGSKHYQAKESIEREFAMPTSIK